MTKTDHSHSSVHTANIESNMNSYRLRERHVTCPFDESHSILPERLWKHIAKCKKNNQAIAATLIRCPYSSVHYLKPDEYDEHIQHCPRKFELMKWFKNV